MNCRSLLVIIILSAGATFTLMDVGSSAWFAYKFGSMYAMEKKNSGEIDWVTNKLVHYTLLILSLNCLLSARLQSAWFPQASYIVYLFFIGLDSPLNVLPKRHQMLLLVSTTILMGHVVINIYGAYFVYQIVSIK